MGRSTAGLEDAPAMAPRVTPLSEMVRVTASRPFVMANAPDERIVPGMADPPLSNAAPSIPFGFEAFDGRLSPVVLRDAAESVAERA